MSLSLKQAFHSSGLACIFIFLLLLLFFLPAVALNEETEIPTYFEAFPPLPERALVETASSRQGVWGKIRPLRSSNITQVRLFLHHWHFGFLSLYYYTNAVY